MSSEQRTEKLVLLALISIFAISLEGCSTWEKLNQTEKGAVIGTGGGALVGSAVGGGAAGTVIGGAAGGVAGGVIGHELDERDRHHR